MGIDTTVSASGRLKTSGGRDCDFPESFDLSRVERKNGQVSKKLTSAAMLCL
jgi:hypothetical protein